MVILVVMNAVKHLECHRHVTVTVSHWAYAILDRAHMLSRESLSSAEYSGWIYLGRKYLCASAD